MVSNFRLVMRSGPSVGKVYPLDKNEVFLGRDLNNDIVINDPEISRRHSRLFLQGNSYVLEDMGSTNGTFVNGQRLMGPHVLRPGDVVTFGERLSLVFEASDFDQDATMVSGVPRSPYGATQVPEAEQPLDYNSPPRQQQPAYPAASGQPAPRQQQAASYAGQVPVAYPINAPPQEKRSPMIWIIAAIILLLLCVCVAGFLFLAPKEFWCLFPVWPAGACP